MVGRKKVRSNIGCKAASQIMRKVTYPEAFLFFTAVGQYTGEFASSLKEFHRKLEKISLRSVKFHFGRGDFEKWISKTLRDENLAKEISKIGKSTQGEDLRKMIQKMVDERLSQLEKFLEKKS